MGFSVLVFFHNILNCVHNKNYKPDSRQAVLFPVALNVTKIA